jgi:hypothetical protein
MDMVVDASNSNRWAIIVSKDDREIRVEFQGNGWREHGNTVFRAEDKMDENA